MSSSYFTYLNQKMQNSSGKNIQMENAFSKHLHFRNNSGMSVGIENALIVGYLYFPDLPTNKAIKPSQRSAQGRAET